MENQPQFDIDIDIVSNIIDSLRFVELWDIIGVSGFLWDTVYISQY